MGVYIEFYFYIQNILVNNIVNHFYDLQADMSIQYGEASDCMGTTNKFCTDEVCVNN